MSNLKQFKDFLISLLTEARELSKQARSKQVQMVLGSNVALLERIAMFISKSIKEGAIDMDKAKVQIKVVSQGLIEEMGRTRKAGEVTTKIIELATELKPGRFVEVSPDGIEGAQFATRVYNLRQDGLLPKDIKPKSNVNGKAGLFLVRLTKEQMTAEPKRRGRVPA